MTHQPESEDRGPLQIGQIFRGTHEICEFIGSGGHAWVYRARHRFLGDEIAIKIIRPEDGADPNALRRAFAEAQVQHNLRDPGIVPVFDAGFTDATGGMGSLPFITMELQRGISLRDVLTLLGCLEIHEAVRLIMRTAIALDAAHKEGVIHRDLKPENVFVVDGNQIKVLDFGVAKIHRAAWVTQRNMILGTPYYMGPQQAQGYPVTPQADIYSLGAMLYECLTGVQPIYQRLGDREHVFSVICAVILNEAPRPLREVDSLFPEYVESFVKQCMAFELDQRFATMVDVANAGGEVLERCKADARARGVELVYRELWRLVPRSGVARVSQDGEDRTIADTNPHSRPLFYGAHSSGVLSADDQPEPSDADASIPPHVISVNAASSSRWPTASEREARDVQLTGLPTAPGSPEARAASIVAPPAKQLAPDSGELNARPLHPSSVASPAPIAIAVKDDRGEEKRLARSAVQEPPRAHIAAAATNQSTSPSIRSLANRRQATSAPAGDGAPEQHRIGLPRPMVLAWGMGGVGGFLIVCAITAANHARRQRPDVETTPASNAPSSHSTESLRPTPVPPTAPPVLPPAPEAPLVAPLAKRLPPAPSSVEAGPVVARAVVAARPAPPRRAPPAPSSKQPDIWAPAPDDDLELHVERVQEQLRQRAELRKKAAAAAPPKAGGDASAPKSWIKVKP